MKQLRLPVVVTGIAIATGCGSMGMDRGLTATPPEPAAVVIDDTAVAAELARRPQLPENPRVAVAFTAPVAPTEEGDAWRWQFAERQTVVKSGDGATGLTLFSLVDAPRDGSFGALRAAAAQQGADAVLSVDGRVEERTEGNAWSVTYALLLPILFAPALELETIFTTRATMRDVRNGYVYLSAESEAAVTQQRAHVSMNRRSAREESRAEAIKELASELKQRFAHAFPAAPSAAAAPAVDAAPADAAPAAAAPADAAPAGESGASP